MLTRLETEFASISDGVGDAGSPTDIERVVLRDGSRIRPLAAGDKAAIASWFTGLGVETRSVRFFVSFAWLECRAQSELARVDHFENQAIAAVAPDGATVGVARYLRSGKSRSVEVAVAVGDDWRGRGIVSMLLERVAARARSVGVDQFIAICLASSHAVIRLLSRLGPATVGPSDAGIVELRIDLASTRPDRCAAGPASGGRGD